MITSPVNVTRHQELFYGVRVEENTMITSQVNVTRHQELRVICMLLVEEHDPQ
jgi:hypothetical protein